VTLHDALRGIEERTEKAGPSDWRVSFSEYGGYDCMSAGYHVMANGYALVTVDVAGYVDNARKNYAARTSPNPEAEALAAFIASSRQDVPALCSTVRALWETVEGMRALLKCADRGLAITGYKRGPWRGDDRGPDVLCDCDGCDALRLAESGMAKAAAAMEGK
jgi:hypothetical protein